MNVSIKNDAFTNNEVLLLSLVFCSLMLDQSLSSISMGCFILYSVYISVKKKRRFYIYRNFLFPLLLYVLFVLSLLWSHDTGLTVKGLGRTVIIAILPLSLSFRYSITQAQLLKIFTIFSYVNCLFGFLFIIDSIISFLRSNDANTFFYHDFVNLLDLNAIYVSSFFYISFIFLLFKKYKSKGDIFCLSFLFMFIFLLSSKVISAITLLSLVIYFIARKKRKSLWWFLLPLFFLFFYVGSGKLSTRITSELETNLSEVIYKEKFTKVYPWTGTSIRLLQIRILKEQLSENYIIILGGFGLFASRESLRENHERLNTYYGFHEYNYHNTYAQMLSELGLIGLILLILNLIYLIKMGFAKNQIWLIFVSVMFSIWFFTETVLWVQRGLFIFILIYCVLVKFEKEPNISN